MKVVERQCVALVEKLLQLSKPQKVVKGQNVGLKDRLNDIGKNVSDNADVDGVIAIGSSGNQKKRGQTVTDDVVEGESEVDRSESVNCGTVDTSAECEIINKETILPMMTLISMGNTSVRKGIQGRNTVEEIEEAIEADRNEIENEIATCKTVGSVEKNQGASIMGDSTTGKENVKIGKRGSKVVEKVVEEGSSMKRRRFQSRRCKE